MQCRFPQRTGNSISNNKQRIKKYHKRCFGSRLNPYQGKVGGPQHRSRLQTPTREFCFCLLFHAPSLMVARISWQTKKHMKHGAFLQLIAHAVMHAKNVFNIDIMKKDRNSSVPYRA